VVDVAGITVDCLTKNVTDNNVVAVHSVLRHHTENQLESPQINFEKCIEMSIEGEPPAGSIYRELLKKLLSFPKSFREMSK